MSLMSPLRSAFLSKGSEFYEVSDEDIAGDPSYFGYLNTSGKWIIQQRNAASGAYRYIQGSSDYTTNWTNRAILSYGLYSTIFTIV